MIIYEFECNNCGNKITTREQESKHKQILKDAEWEQTYGSHTCRECRPKGIQRCHNKCGSRATYFITDQLSKEDQLRDQGWVEHQGDWFCDDHCLRDHLFGE